MEYTHITHPFPPLYDATSRILILGSLEDGPVGGSMECDPGISVVFRQVGA